MVFLFVNINIFVTLMKGGLYWVLPEHMHTSLKQMRRSI